MIDLHNTDQKYGYIQIWLKSTEGNLKCCVNIKVFLPRQFFFNLVKELFSLFKDSLFDRPCVFSAPSAGQWPEGNPMLALTSISVWWAALRSGRRRNLLKPQLLIGKGDVTSWHRSSCGCGSELWDQALVCCQAATKELCVYPYSVPYVLLPFRKNIT